MPAREPEYNTGGAQVFRVYDRALKRRYTTATITGQVDDGLEILDQPANDGGGQPLPPEFDVTKTGTASTDSTSQEATK